MEVEATYEFGPNVDLFGPNQGLMQLVFQPTAGTIAQKTTDSVDDTMHLNDLQSLSTHARDCLRQASAAVKELTDRLQDVDHCMSILKDLEKAAQGQMVLDQRREAAELSEVE